jgi:hypothetical protein
VSGGAKLAGCTGKLSRDASHSPDVTVQP